jgi:hypothetical protein
MEATTQMLLSWFADDELTECPLCGYNHLLPVWGEKGDARMCASCGFVGPLSVSSNKTP